MSNKFLQLSARMSVCMGQKYDISHFHVLAYTLTDRFVVSYIRYTMTLNRAEMETKAG